MKQLLAFCLSLLTVLSMAQTTTLQSSVIMPRTGVLSSPAYTVVYTRNWTTYPATVDGVSSLTRAISTGAISMTTANSGCVLRQYVPLPLIAPTCSPVLPSWLTALRYSYDATNNNLLTLEAAGTVGAIKFLPIRGNGFPTTTPNSATIVANQDYSYGPNTGQGIYDRQWKLYYSGSVMQLVLKDAVTAQTFSVYLAPAAGASKVILLSDITAVPPSSTTTTPQSTTAPAPTLAGGFAEGTMAELFALAPFTPSVNQIASWPQGVTGQYLNNGIIKLGLLKSVGATVTHLSLNGGQNLINTNTNGFQTTFEGQPAPGLGRSGPGMGLYGYPNGFNGATSARFIDVNDYGQTLTSSDIGWNASQSGSGSGDHSPILWYERRSIGGVNYIYTKTQPYQWGMASVKSKMYIHNYWWLDGQVARNYSILENFRPDNQGLYWGREQEAPFTYAIAPLYKKVTYTGTNPFTGGALTYYSLSEPTEGGNSQTNNNDTGTFNSSEGWAGVVNADGSMGVFLITPYNNRFRGKQFQRWVGDSTTSASSYINSSVMLNFDHPQNLAYKSSVFAGSINSFRNYINASPPATMPFSWTFTGTRTNGWWSENGAAKIIDGRYQFNIGFGRPGDIGTPLEGTIVRFATLASPFGAWLANSIPTLYIKGRFTSTNITNLKLVWRKPGAEFGAPEYEKTFTAEASTAEQTIAIPMASTPNWTGVISNVRFKLADFTQNMAGNEMFIPSYIGNVAPNAVGDWQTLVGLSVLAGGLRRRKRRISDRGALEAGSQRSHLISKQQAV